MPLTIFNTYLIKKKSVNDLQMIAFVFTETLSSKLQYGGLFPWQHVYLYGMIFKQKYLPLSYLNVQWEENKN